MKYGQYDNEKSSNKGRTTLPEIKVKILNILLNKFLFFACPF